MTRILVVPSWFPTKDRPLSGIFFLEQTKLFADSNHEFDVHVCVFEEPRQWVSPRYPRAVLRAGSAAVTESVRESERVSENYSIHRFSSFAWQDKWESGGIDLDARRAVRLARRISADGVAFDLVHAHVSYPGGMIGRKVAEVLGVPFVLSEHMSPFPFDDLRQSDGRIARRVRWPIEGARFLSAVSAAHAREISLESGVMPHVVPNFVSGLKFSPSASRPNRGKFVSVGHLVEQKGFDILLRAFSGARERAPEITLTIVGDGKERTSLERLSESLDLSTCVTFSGAVSREELPRFYQNADYFVLASRHESFGVVVIEALASGLPCVVTRCGGPEEIITDESVGVVVESDSASAMEIALLQVLAREWNPSAIRNFFEERFSDGVVSRQWADIYRSLV